MWSFVVKFIRNAGWTAAKSFLGVNGLLNQRQSKVENALESVNPLHEFCIAKL